MENKVLILILVCFNFNLVNCQKISDYKCDEYKKYKLVSNEEKGPHIGKVFYVDPKDNEWLYIYGTILSARFVISEANFLVNVELSDMYFKHEKNEFDIIRKIANPYFIGNFIYHDIMLLEISGTHSDFRYACIWTDQNTAAIQSTTAIDANDEIQNIKLFNIKICFRSDTNINKSHSCVDPIPLSTGSPIQFKQNNIMYLESVQSWHVINDAVTEYRIGIKILPYIKWIERTIWPELSNLPKDCSTGNKLDFIDENSIKYVACDSD